MLYLPNGCRCSEPSVFPKNWKSKQAPMDKPWYINYRFYDPAQPKPKQVIIKGMNDASDLKQRQEITRVLLTNELNDLQYAGYNPFYKRSVAHLDESYGIDPDTGFIKALNRALDSIKCTEPTRRDFRSVIKYCTKAAQELLIHSMPISMIRKKHIRMLLDHLPKTKDYWSPNQHNHYRKHLSMLFAELVDQETVDVNPVQAVKKQRVLQRIRPTMTIKERKKVKKYLQSKDPLFWRWIHIFFHSGAREAELMRVRREDVDLAAGTFKVTIKKGKTYSEVLKPIKNLAAADWRAVVREAAPGEFLFSRFLKPGPVSIDPRVITKRFLKVKKALGINADLYSLKHSNLDETAAALSIQDAANMADHTTPVITLNTYAVGEKGRQREKLKKVNNPF